MGIYVINNRIKKPKSGYINKGSYFIKILNFIIAIFSIVLVFRCESSEVFYRPDLPEKLCSIGIVDLDDTTLRHISFEKSLDTYGKISRDPFAEPIYINGNIKGGNGIFALCRSRELKITFSPWI